MSWLLLRMQLKLTEFRVCQGSCVAQVQKVNFGTATDILALPQFTSCISASHNFLDRCEIQSISIVTIFPTSDLGNISVQIKCPVKNKQLL